MKALLTILVALVLGAASNALYELIKFAYKKGYFAKCKSLLALFQRGQIQTLGLYNLVMIEPKQMISPIYVTYLKKLGQYEKPSYLEALAKYTPPSNIPSLKLDNTRDRNRPTLIGSSQLRSSRAILKKNLILEF